MSDQSEIKYPHEFLGRCQTCLDNAYLDSKPCAISYEIGAPLFEHQCMVARAQKQFRDTAPRTEDKE